MCNHKNINNDEIMSLSQYAEKYFEEYMKNKIDNTLLFLNNFEINFSKLDEVLESREPKSVDDELLLYLNDDLVDCFGNYDFGNILVELQNFLFYIKEGYYVLDVTDFFPSEEVLLKKGGDFYIVGVMSGQGTMTYISKHSNFESIDNNKEFNVLDYDLLVNFVNEELSVKE